MNKMAVCISIETKKLFRSKIPLITMAVLTLIPFIGGFFMFILKDPSLAESLGFISAKAQLMGTADWSSYLSLLSQAIAIGGLFAFGFITSWIFGREYSDRTIRDLLALPVSRGIIVASKFIVMILWCLFLSAFVLILGLIVGNMVDIPGMSSALLMDGIKIYMICSLLTILLSTPVGFFASYGRGYLSPLGFIVISLILAQIVATTGYGEFFPWSIPAIIGIDIGNGEPMVSGISITIVFLTSILGLVSTMLWWRHADQS